MPQITDEQIVEQDDIRKPPSYREDRPQVVTTDTVRQGPSGWPVLYVLIAGLAAVCITLGGYVLLWSGQM